MDEKFLFRLGAGILVLIAILVTLIELDRRGSMAVITKPAPGTAGDRLRSDLLRCRALGKAAAKDKGCLAVWTESRRRFLQPHSPANRSE